MAIHPPCYLDAPAWTQLDLASILVREVLGATPYLVGSVLTRPDYRDVDVRVVLADEDYDRLFAGREPHPLRHFLEARLSEHYATHTGLPVDFQIQRRTEANARHDGPRIPLVWARGLLRAQREAAAS